MDAGILAGLNKEKAKKEMPYYYEIWSKRKDLDEIPNAEKDRTEVVTALILKLLGVDEKEIAVDYIASGIFLNKMLEDYANSINNKEILKIITPKQDTIFKMFRYIQDNYGSIEEYLKQCGITDNTINRIREKYT